MADLTKQIQLILSAKDNASLALKGVENRFSGLGEAGRQLLNVLGPLAGAFAFREVVKASTDFEGYNNALKAVLGTQEAAGQQIEFIRALSNKLGLDFEKTTESYTKFVASAKQGGVSLEDTQRIFGAVGAATAVLGLSSEDARGAMRALEQMISKGKVSAEELRQQLGERMPGAFGLFAKSMGVSTTQLDDMLKKGEVLASETLPGFAEALLDAYGPGVADAAESTRAAINRFNNDLFQLKLELADAGVIDAFTEALGLISGVVGHPDFKAALVDLGAGFEGLVDKAGGSKEFVGGLVKVFETLSLGVQTVLVPLEVLGETIGAVGAAISFAITGDFANAARVLEEFDPIGQLEQGFADLEPTVERFLGDSKEVVDATKEQGQAAAAAAVGVKKLTAEEQIAADAIKQSRLASERDAEAKKKQSKEADKAAETAAKLAVELEKIASNERIKKIELFVEFNTELLKSSTERAKALIENIGTTVTSTGDLLGGLFDNLGDASSFTERWRIEDQIDEENRRRDEALRQQKELNAVEIQLSQEKLRRLKAGDALIKIDGTGLEPELEAFMWAVITRVQVRANEEQAEFLLGV